MLDVEDKCKMFKIDFGNYKDYNGECTKRDIDGLGSAFNRGLLNSIIKEIEYIIHPPLYSGIKLSKIFDTSNT